MVVKKEKKTRKADSVKKNAPAVAKAMEGNKKEVKKAETKKEVKKKYIEAIGRRKEAVARVRLIKDKPGFVINGKTIEKYFTLEDHRKKIFMPFQLTDSDNSFFVSVKVTGGGMTGQAEAIRLGISRCLIKIDEKLKPILRKAGFLTRDARIVERKKYGFKKARKAPQWSKR